jgi:hypothetical protein
MSHVTSGLSQPEADAEPGELIDLPEVRIWRRSSRCGSHGSCVEVSDFAGGAVAVRDGKTPERSPILVFSDEEWSSFIAGVKAGEFD